jgi:hypothetical protein
MRLFLGDRRVDIISVTGNVYSDSLATDISILLAERPVCSETFDLYFRAEALNDFLTQYAPKYDTNNENLQN